MSRCPDGSHLSRRPKPLFSIIRLSQCELFFLIASRMGSSFFPPQPSGRTPFPAIVRFIERFQLFKRLVTTGSRCCVRVCEWVSVIVCVEQWCSMSLDGIVTVSHIGSRGSA